MEWAVASSIAGAACLTSLLMFAGVEQKLGLLPVFLPDPSVGGWFSNLAFVIEMSSQNTLLLLAVTVAVMGVCQFATYKLAYDLWKRYRKRNERREVAVQCVAAEGDASLHLATYAPPAARREDLPTEGRECLVSGKVADYTGDTGEGPGAEDSLSCEVICSSGGKAVDDGADSPLLVGTSTAGSETAEELLLPQPQHEVGQSRNPPVDRGGGGDQICHTCATRALREARKEAGRGESERPVAGPTAENPAEAEALFAGDDRPRDLLENAATSGRHGEDSQVLGLLPKAARSQGPATVNTSEEHDAELSQVKESQEQLPVSESEEQLPVSEIQEQLPVSESEEELPVSESQEQLPVSESEGQEQQALNGRTLALGVEEPQIGGVASVDSPRLVAALGEKEMTAYEGSQLSRMVGNRGNGSPATVMQQHDAMRRATQISSPMGVLGHSSVNRQEDPTARMPPQESWRGHSSMSADNVEEPSRRQVSYRADQKKRYTIDSATAKALLQHATSGFRKSAHGIYRNMLWNNNVTPDSMGSLQGNVKHGSSVRVENMLAGLRSSVSTSASSESTQSGEVEKWLAVGNTTVSPPPSSTNSTPKV